MYGILNFKKENVFEASCKEEKNTMSYRFQGNTYRIVFSGHLYNLKELKEMLIRKDFEIETNQETEILIKLYISFGKDVIHRLNGAYSFAIWNEKEKELLVVRDRFGLEPLYYAMKNGNFIFASSIKEILNHSEIKAQMDRMRNSRINWNRSCSFSG
ncbi:MAG: DUF1933 domain-containing protein [Clostridia bacterium]|nr:DUF1933 domain-containing protein [Clostridia bacterium]